MGFFRKTISATACVMLVALISCKRGPTNDGVVVFEDQDAFPAGGASRSILESMGQAGLVTRQAVRNNGGEIEYTVSMDPEAVKSGNVSYKFEVRPPAWRKVIYSVSPTNLFETLICDAWVKARGNKVGIALAVHRKNGSVDSIDTPPAQMVSRDTWSHVSIQMPTTNAAEIVDIEVSLFSEGPGILWVDGVAVKSHTK